MTWFQFKASDPHKRMVLQTAQDTHRALRHLINKAQLTGKTEELSEFISTTTNDLKDVLPPQLRDDIFAVIRGEKSRF